MTLDEMVEEISELEQSMAEIRGQLDAATARYRDEGIPADRKWFASARHALRMKGMQHQKLLREAAILRRQQAKSVRSLSDFFVDVSREELDTQDFDEMMQIARERKNAHDAELLSAS